MMKERWYTENGGRELVSVADELDHVRQYLYIRKERYGDKLDYEIGEAGTLSDYTVPKIILQPVVENSIYHGIKPLDGSGHIAVTVKETEEKLIFTVADNGAGFNPEKTRTGETERKSSVGLKNVDERLKLYYGPDYGLQIDSSPGKGCTVNLIVGKRILGRLKAADDE